MLLEGDAVRTETLPETMPVRVPNAGDALDSDLFIPRGALGLVVLAHITGRDSAASESVADRLHAEFLATLQVDLLTADEARADAETDQLRLDVELLAERLQRVVFWLQTSAPTADLRVGLFATGTAAAAAIVVAARHPEWIKALVLHAARPDLAVEYVPRVQAPTLLIVDHGHDEVVRINHQAHDEIKCKKSLETIAGSAWPSEEAGPAEELTRLTGEWFTQYLALQEHAGST